MSEEELYKLLNIPNKPWIELTDEEIQLFEKNNNYIKQLQQENTQLKQMVNSPSITFTTCPECGKKYSVNYCRETYKLKQQLQQIREYCENGIIDINCGNIGTGSLRGQLKDILEILNSGGAE